MIGSLATFGYSDPATAWELEAAMRVNPRALLVDSRLTPYCSWSETWQRATLARHYGTRYVWRGDWLGNVNHTAPGAPIQLADAPRGLAWLIRLVEGGATVVVLCGCLSYDRCHRKVIADQVKAALGPRLPDFVPGERVWTPCGAGTIDPQVPRDVHHARNRYAVVLDVPGPRRYFSPDELRSAAVVQPRLIA